MYYALIFMHSYLGLERLNSNYNWRTRKTVFTYGDVVLSLMIIDKRSQ